MNSGIYYIKNTISNKGYIGSTKHFNKRFKQHLLELRKNTHRNQHLQSAYNKYGEDSFVFTIIDFCDPEELFVLEQLYLEDMKYNSEYNICKIAGPPPKLTFTKELKQTMSNASKTRANTPEERSRLKMLAINTWSDPKHREFMQEINRGENHPQARITEDLARKIKIDICSGDNYWGKNLEIARKYNVTKDTVKSIKYGKTWKFIKV